MCSNCCSLCYPRRFHSPNEYKKIIQELVDKINDGDLLLVSQTCPLSETDAYLRLQPEMIVHYFCCPVCEQFFVLTVYLTSHTGYGIFDKSEKYYE